MKSTPTPLSRHAIRLAAMLTLMAASAVMLSACRTGPRDVREGPIYPEAVPLAETLDIQVFRHETVIELTNTTARPLGPSTLWLNRHFGRPIDGLAIGQTIRLPLPEFRNRFDEPFRAGGFFAVELPERVAVAELETVDPEGERVVYGLVVVGPGL